MKRRISPADRLIKIIVRHRGAATLRQIARTHLTGTDFEEAKRATAGLVVFEPTYQNGRRKRSQTARLTQKGVWQAIRLTRGYDPALAVSALAAVDIKAILDRLEAERNPLGLELAGYRHDAQAFRAQDKRREAREREAWKTIEKVREILARPRRKLSARHYEKLNQFLESRGINRTVKVSAFGQPAFAPTPVAGQIPSGPRVATPPINPRPAPKPPTLTGFRCRECDHDTSAHMQGCPREGQLEGAFAVGKPKTLAEAPLLVKQLRENVDAKQAALSANCLICQSDKMLGQKTPHDCARYQAA